MVVLMDNGRQLKAYISPHHNSLNSTGWFKIGDIVLVSTQNFVNDCQLIMKQSSKTKPLLENESLMNNDKITVGLLSA